MDFTIVRTADPISQTPEPGMIRHVLAHNDNLMLVRHFFQAGWSGASHSHPHDQIVYVIQGSLLVNVAGNVFEAHSGDSFVVNGGIEHHASALTASEVLDVFTPIREDYRPA